MMYNAKSAQASRWGQFNRSEGAIFERYIGISCELYRREGVADIQKTPEPFVVTKELEQGRFVGHYARKAQPDFQGCLKGGRNVVFDAKATVTDKIQISVLTDEQRKILIQRADLGAVSGVMMSFSFKRFAFVPIDVFLRAKELNGHKHWTADEASKHGKEIRFTGSRLLFMDGDLT